MLDSTNFLLEEAKDIRKEIETYRRYYIQQIFVIGGIIPAIIILLKNFLPTHPLRQFLITLLALGLVILFFYFWQIQRKIYVMRRYLELLERRFLGNEQSAKKSLFGDRDHVNKQPIGFTTFDMNDRNIHWIFFNDPVLNSLVMLYFFIVAIIFLGYAPLISAIFSWILGW